MYFQKILFSVTALLFLAGGLTAQNLTLQLQKTDQFLIDGDSNVRDWDADVTDVTGTLVLTGVENLSLDNITSESFTSLNMAIPVSEIESGSGRMTRNLQHYLKGEDHPEITFRLNRVNSIEMQNGKAQITADGIINAAGKNKNVTMNVEAVVTPDGSIRFTGEQELLMTDFGIDPPTAMLGSIRSADEVVILFDVTFGN